MNSIAQRGWRAWAEAAWAGGADPTIITPLPMFRLNPWDPLYQFPEEQADKVCGRWDELRLPDELCGVHVYWSFPKLTSPSLGEQWGLTLPTLLEHFRRGFVDPGDVLDKCRRFHRRLRRKARMLYSNEENLMTVFQLPQEWLGAIMSDPIARRWMPAGMDDATPESTHEWWKNNRRHATLFNGHASDLVFRSLDRTFAAAGMLDNGARLIQSFATRATRPVFDLNGWEQTQRFVSSRTSNAQLYCSGGQRYQGGSTPEGWRCFLDAIEYARACTDYATGHSFAASVCTNGDLAAEAKASGKTDAKTLAYTHPWVFNQLLGHLCRMQQPSQPFRDIVLFNQYATPAREAQVQSQLLSHMNARPASVLPSVSLDLATVTTGLFGTMLRDYQANVH